jgi:hypothetical protein
VSDLPFNAAQHARTAKRAADTLAAACDALQPVTLGDFLKRKIPPRELILAPWLPERGLAMIYAWRGIGKTWLSLALAHAIASGGSLLRWQAPRPRRVLLVDGEMPQATLQERLAQIVSGATRDAPDENLMLLLADEFERGIPGLNTLEGQAAIERMLADIDVLILDNVSTLFGRSAENDADEWAPVQEWLLRLRRLGKSAIVIHHAGKTGDQRGTSRREDVLDSTIELKRPDDYRADQGARFVVRLTKARGVCGPEAADFEAQLLITAGKAMWSATEPEPDLTAKAHALRGEGLTQREIAAQLGKGLGTINRRLKEADSRGLA